MYQQLRPCCMHHRGLVGAQRPSQLSSLRVSRDVVPATRGLTSNHEPIRTHAAFHQCESVLLAAGPGEDRILR